MNGDDIGSSYLDYSAGKFSLPERLAGFFWHSLPTLHFLQSPRPRPIIRPLLSGPVPSKLGMVNPQDPFSGIITHMSIKI
jgi:hypothetical protein